ncbi:Orf26 [Heliothis zea nudivirus]|uniref:Orf26 n=1 Tax=Heliothis zea nudivirus 1 TaxID=3116536 RepID=Q8JKT5_9VIRU|nr:Orf26 [Heliothis zea nudivirus]AAN04321.1 Orf26 [Heliothis zea nudivirus]
MHNTYQHMILTKLTLYNTYQINTHHYLPILTKPTITNTYHYLPIQHLPLLTNPRQVKVEHIGAVVCSVS